MKLKRLNSIVEYVKSYEVCTYEELCNHFGISMSTIRRDVSELIRDGKIEKTHGGICASSKLEESKDKKQLIKFDYTKDSIARLASEMVEDNDIIILASGSTVAHMVKYLKDKKNITVITNNLVVLNEAMSCDFNVVNIGGNLDRKAMSFVGTQTTKQISELNANKCFISCNGISLNGISNVVDLEANIKQAEMKIGQEIILLADHTKFGVMSLYNIAPIEELDYLITDKRVNKEYEQAFKEANVKVLVAE